MEAQDLRISRLEKMATVSADSQTETIRILQEQSRRLDAVLERLDDHGLTLQEHSRILLDHSKRLGNLEQLMTRVLEELVAIKEILASSRGMGFAPEPEDSQ